MSLLSYKLEYFGYVTRIIPLIQREIQNCNSIQAAFLTFTNISTVDSRCRKYPFFEVIFFRFDIQDVENPRKYFISSDISRN